MHIMGNKKYNKIENDSDLQPAVRRLATWYRKSNVLLISGETCEVDCTVTACILSVYCSSELQQQ